MEQVHGIRHLVLAEGWTIRRAAREFEVSRNAVRAGLHAGVSALAAELLAKVVGIHCGS